LTVHRRIMRAAKRNTGLKLTAVDVRDLSRDNAIETCARNDDEADEEAEEEVPPGRAGHRLEVGHDPGPGAGR